MIAGNVKTVFFMKSVYQCNISLFFYQKGLVVYIRAQ